MFVKFTRLDNSPIWLNASFIVTVEPRRGGGSVVVPVGDGLDYDVRESPEAVLAILGEAPAPAVLPIPTTDALVKKPVADTPVPAPQPSEPVEQPAAEAPAKKPAKKTTRKKKAAVAEPAPEAPAEPAPEAQPSTPPTLQPSDPPTLQPSTPPTALVLTEGEIERLRKLAPRTLRKLGNTLKTQFKFEDPEVGVQDLLSRGFILVNEQRVHWL